MWNLNKKLERFIKVYILMKDAEGLSAMNSEAYATRFYHFMELFVTRN